MDKTWVWGSVVGDPDPKLFAKLGSGLSIWTRIRIRVRLTQRDTFPGPKILSGTSKIST